MNQITKTTSAFYVVKQSISNLATSLQSGLPQYRRSIELKSGGTVIFTSRFTKVEGK